MYFCVIIIIVEQKEIKHLDTHGSAGMTRWVHKHRRMATWIIKLLVASIASFLYYLRKQEREIEKEEKGHSK